MMTTAQRPPRHDPSGRHHTGSLLMVHLVVSLTLWALIIWFFNNFVG